MMTTEEWLKLFANTTILYIGITLLAFIALYAFFFNWRSTSGGRSVMYFVSSLELLILLAAFLQWSPEDLLQAETEQLLRWEVYLTIAAASTRMLVVLIGRWFKVGRIGIDVELRNRHLLPSTT